MKIYVVLLFLALSVQAFLPGGMAKREPTDGHLTTSSGALGALFVVSSSVNLADAVPGGRRRRLFSGRRRRRTGRRRGSTNPACIGSILCGKK